MSQNSLPRSRRGSKSKSPSRQTVNEGDNEGGEEELNANQPDCEGESPSPTSKSQSPTYSRRSSPPKSVKSSTHSSQIQSILEEEGSYASGARPSSGTPNSQGSTFRRSTPKVSRSGTKPVSFINLDDNAAQKVSEACIKPNEQETSYLDLPNTPAQQSQQIPMAIALDEANVAGYIVGEQLATGSIKSSRSRCPSSCRGLQPQAPPGPHETQPAVQGCCNQCQMTPKTKAPPLIADSPQILQCPQVQNCPLHAPQHFPRPVRSPPREVTLRVPEQPNPHYSHDHQNLGSLQGLIEPDQKTTSALSHLTQIRKTPSFSLCSTNKDLEFLQDCYQSKKVKEKITSLPSKVCLRQEDLEQLLRCETRDVESALFLTGDDRKSYKKPCPKQQKAQMTVKALMTSHVLAGQSCGQQQYSPLEHPDLSEISPEVAAAMMFSQERGIQMVDCPNKTINSLFPDEPRNTFPEKPLGKSPSNKLLKSSTSVFRWNLKSKEEDGVSDSAYTRTMKGKSEGMNAKKSFDLDFAIGQSKTEYVLVSQKPQRVSKVQYRGGSSPSWFPGSQEDILNPREPWNEEDPTAKQTNKEWGKETPEKVQLKHLEDKTGKGKEEISKPTRGEPKYDRPQTVPEEFGKKQDDKPKPDRPQTVPEEFGKKQDDKPKPDRPQTLPGEFGRKPEEQSRPDKPKDATEKGKQETQLLQKPPEKSTVEPGKPKTQTTEKSQPEIPKSTRDEPNRDRPQSVPQEFNKKQDDKPKPDRPQTVPGEPGKKQDDQTKPDRPKDLSGKGKDELKPVTGEPKGKPSDLKTGKSGDSSTAPRVPEKDKTGRPNGFSGTGEPKGKPSDQKTSKSGDSSTVQRVPEKDKTGRADGFSGNEKEKPKLSSERPKVKPSEKTSGPGKDSALKPKDQTTEKSVPKPTTDKSKECPTPLLPPKVQTKPDRCKPPETEMWRTPIAQCEIHSKKPDEKMTCAPKEDSNPKETTDEKHTCRLQEIVELMSKDKGVAGLLGCKKTPKARCCTCRAPERVPGGCTGTQRTERVGFTGWVPGSGQVPRSNWVQITSGVPGLGRIQVTGRAEGASRIAVTGCVQEPRRQSKCRSQDGKVIDEKKCKQFVCRK